MLRPVLISTLLFVALQGAQAQVQFHGPPASITSPGPDGSLHGVPASILSPTPVRNPNGRVFIGGHQRIPFGNPRLRHRRNLVPVPIFIPAYDLSDLTVSEADPPVSGQYASPEPEQAAEAESVREAYYRGAHDALARQQQADARYGQHYFDSREKTQAKAPPADEKKPEKTKAKEAAPPAPAPEPEDISPATVFIFKDGHKLETQNFAITGQTLFDFSGKTLRKIKLAELDLDATRKANDLLGIDIRLP